MVRLDYIDIAKGIGILAVVWAHILVKGVSHEIIYAFHMPLFFFLSGMLFRPDKYENFFSFVKAKTKRLIIPYLVYSILTWAVWVVFRSIRGEDYDFFKPLLQTLLAQGSGAYLVHNSALWFIPCLFAVELIYYGFVQMKEWATIAFCVFMSVVGSVLMFLYGDNYLQIMPWNLDAALFALPFYCAGNVIVAHFSHETIVNWGTEHSMLMLTILLLITPIMIFLATSYGECSMGSSSYNCPLWCFYTRAFLGCSIVIILSILLSSNNILNNYLSPIKWCGKNSLDIMCLHVPIKGFVMIMLVNLWGKLFPYNGLLLPFLSFMITMLIIFITIQLINKIIRKI